MIVPSLDVTHTYTPHAIMAYLAPTKNNRYPKQEQPLFAR